MTRQDIVLATVECARWDYRDHLRPDADLKTHKGITAGHYTRPSLAGLHAPTWDSVVDARVRGQTLAETLSHAGYATQAISYSPQTASFGFGRGFDETQRLEPDIGRVGRGSRLRERLAEYRTVRWVKRQLQDKHATFEDIPRDASVVEHARDALRADRDKPLFLWIHFMGSHRPYGWDDDAIPPALSRDLASAGTGGLAEPDPGTLKQQVDPHYTGALERIGGYLSELLSLADDDTSWLICGDHGEEMGEDGYFLHSGYRRRVVDPLVNVPVFTRTVDINGPVSLLDVGAHLTDAAGVETPGAWDTRPGRESFLTVAPWDGTATLRYQTPDSGVDLRFESANLRQNTESDTSRAVESQLEALGYRGVG